MPLKERNQTKNKHLSTFFDGFLKHLQNKGDNPLIKKITEEIPKGDFREPIKSLFEGEGLAPLVEKIKLIDFKDGGLVKVAVVFPGGKRYVLDINIREIKERLDEFYLKRRDLSDFVVVANIKMYVLWTILYGEKTAKKMLNSTLQSIEKLEDLIKRHTTTNKKENNLKIFIKSYYYDGSFSVVVDYGMAKAGMHLDYAFEYDEKDKKIKPVVLIKSIQFYDLDKMFKEEEEKRKEFSSTIAKLFLLSMEEFVKNGINVYMVSPKHNVFLKEPHYDHGKIMTNVYTTNYGKYGKEANAKIIGYGAIRIKNDEKGTATFTGTTLNPSYWMKIKVKKIDFERIRDDLKNGKRVKR